ncbi:MAG: hypothetical protein KDA28_04320, partial [Phycisphaerales bacterium]|nr:hypothetical protein [Phycisphaerales bacterium]
MSVVVKVGGKALHDGAVAIALAEASASVDHLVVVHGGGSDVDALLERLGHVSQRIEGRRVTPASEIDIIAGVLAGSANKRLVASMRAEACRAVGVSLVDLDAH